MSERSGLREGDLLGVSQALRLLPVSRASVYRLAAAGHIESVRVPMPGGRFRLLLFRASLEAYVTSLRTAPPETETVDGILARITAAQQP